jgi:antitoxin component of MazEF toxin-antitoxin module
MAETEVEVRKWGNSLGIVIPADIVRAEGLAPHDRALVRIMKVRRPDPRAFGFLRAKTIDAQAAKDRLRSEHEA